MRKAKSISYQWAYHLRGVWEEVDDRVPHWVQVLSLINGGDFEEVSTSVTLGVGVVNSGWGVEWLVDVSQVVDQKSQGIWLCLILITNVWFHSLVDERALVVSSAREPVLDSRNHSADIFLIELKSWEVRNGAALVKEGGVNEVPAGLPRTSLGLDFVGEGGALYERVLTFEVGHAGLSLRVDLQEVVGSIKSWWVLILKFVKSDSCNWKKQWEKQKLTYPSNGLVARKR
jgi:hypothetical protein